MDRNDIDRIVERFFRDVKMVVLGGILCFGAQFCYTVHQCNQRILHSTESVETEVVEKSVEGDELTDFELLAKKGVPLFYMHALVSQDSQGFGTHEIASLHQDGVPLEYIQIANEEGKRFDGSQLRRLYENEVPLEYITAFSEKNDRFSVSDIQYMYEKKVPSTVIEGLGHLADIDGELFDRFDLVSLKEVPVEYSAALASMRNSKGGRIFGVSDITSLHKQEVPLDFIKKLALVEDRDGLVLTKWDLQFLFSRKVPKEFAFELLQVRVDGKARFDENDIRGFHEDKVELEYAKSLGTLKSRGKPALGRWDIIRLKDAKVDVGTVRDIVEMYNQHDVGVGIDDIRTIARKNVPLETVEPFLEVKREGRPVIDVDVMVELHKHKADVAALKPYAEIKDGEGKYAFDSKNIFLYWLSNGTVDYYNKLSALRNKEGKPLLKTEDIAQFSMIDHIRRGGKLLPVEIDDVYTSLKEIQDHFKPRTGDAVGYIKSMMDVENLSASVKEMLHGYLYGVPIGFIEEAVNKGEKDFWKICRFYQLGLSPDEKFEDTRKPNALIVYPTSRKRGMAFENIGSLNLYGRIVKRYDTKVVIAGEEEDVYRALQETPDIEFLFLNGHGQPEKLSLNDDVKDEEEKYFIDTSDDELKGYLGNLAKNAVIFLGSCSNGKGGKRGKNLANFVRKISGRKVISSKDPFMAEHVKVKSIYPFDVRIVNEMTYVGE